MVVGFARVGASSARWIGVALVFMSAVFLTLAYTVHAPTALLLLACIGFLDGTTDVLFETIVQREVDPQYYGRVFGLASAFFTTTMMSAVATAPLLNQIAAPQAVITVAAIGLLVAAVVALVGTRPRTEPVGEPARVGSL
jgi:MFS family permease